MAKVSRESQPLWVNLVRKHLRSLVIAEGGRPEPGWMVGGDKKGNAFVQHRQPTHTAYVRLPYRWEEGEAANLMQRLTQIRTVMVKQALPLTQAAEVANGRSSVTGTDGWAEAIKKFKLSKTSTGRVPCSEPNWAERYEPFLDLVLKLVQGKRPPTDSTELLERLVNSKPTWKPGSRTRQIAVGNVSAFLRFGVERCGFQKAWLPPSDTRRIIGMRKDRKREPVPLSDAQIIRLVESFPEGDPWRFLFQLLAVYGLRPEDARQLTVREGRFFSQYEKASGAGYTAARFLHPLPVIDTDGSEVEWNLLGRWKAGERIPNLGEKGQAADKITSKLKRNDTWQSLRAEHAAEGRQLVPYAFRHRYVKRGQLKGIPPKILSVACGHSLETHLRTYSAWDAESEMLQHFPAAKNDFVLAG